MILNDYIYNNNDNNKIIIIICHLSHFVLSIKSSNPISLKETLRKKVRPQIYDLCRACSR